MKNFDLLLISLKNVEHIVLQLYLTVHEEDVSRLHSVWQYILEVGEVIVVLDNFFCILDKIRYSCHARKVYRLLSKLIIIHALSAKIAAKYLYLHVFENIVAELALHFHVFIIIGAEPLCGA